MSSSSSSSSAAVTNQLLGQLLSNEASDEQMVDHLWKTYDPKILSSLFSQVKSLADQAFRNKDFAQAIQYYTGCILLVRNAFERSKLYSNRSLCFFKSGKYELAYSDGLKCLALTSKSAKAWYRCATALAAIGQSPETALLCMERSLKYLDDPQQKDALLPELQAIKELVEQRKRIRRYQTDYSRFENLAKLITAQEQEVTTEQPMIEFNEESNLSDSQKAYLRSQITGEPVSVSTVSPAAAAAAQNLKRTAKLDIDWRTRGIVNSGAQHEKAAMILREFLYLQAYVSFTTKTLSYLDSTTLGRAMNKQYEEKLNSNDRVLLVAGTSVNVLGVLKIMSKCKQVVIVSDSLLTYELITSLAPSGAVAADRLKFLTTAQLLRGRKEKKERVQEKLPDAGESEKTSAAEMDLRKQGESVLLHASSNCASKSEDSVGSVLKSLTCMVLDLDAISPYLLTPNNPITLLRAFPKLRLTLPTRVALNVALAYIDVCVTDPSTSAALSADPSLAEAEAGDSLFDHYSLLPLPLPTAIASRCRLVTESASAWTLGEFSELPDGKSLEVVMSRLIHEPDSSFNAVVFSITVWAGSEMVLDSWELYQDAADERIPQSVLQPHFYWLHPHPAAPVQCLNSRVSSHRLTTVTTPRLLSAYLENEIPQREMQSSEFLSVKSGDLETPPKQRHSENVQLLRRGSSSSSSHSSSSSSRRMRMRWMSELRRGMFDTGSGSPQDSRSQALLGPRVGHKTAIRVSLQLLNGCVVGTNVAADGQVFTSSENLMVTGSVSGLKWHVSPLLRWQPPSCGKPMWTPKSTTPLTSSSASLSTDGEISLVQRWLNGVSALRDQKLADIATRERRIRAHMVQTEGYRSRTMRTGVLNVSDPLVAFQTIVRLLKKGTDYLADNAIIDLHSGLDVFCNSFSTLRVLRRALWNRSNLTMIRETVLNSRRPRHSLEWRRSSGSVVVPQIEDAIVEVRKFLFEDKYLRLDQADMAELRPVGCDKQELIQAVSMLYNCPPATPGIEQLLATSLEIKQRYDLLIFETPETLADLVDWLSSRYVRRLLFAKNALLERNAWFYPAKLILKAFLAYFAEPAELTDKDPRTTAARVNLVNELRSIDNAICWDSCGALRVSEVVTVVDLDLNSGLKWAELEPKVLDFKLLDGSTEDTAEGAVQSQPADACQESGSGSTHQKESDAESAGFLEINLEDSTSLLRNTSPFDISARVPPPHPLNHRETRRFTIASFDESVESVSGFSPQPSAVPAPDRANYYNAVITYAEYDLGTSTGLFTHAPASLSCEGTLTHHRFPEPKQRFHRLPLAQIAESHSAGETGGKQVSLRWMMSAQGEDYEFCPMRVGQRLLPPPSRLKTYLDNVNDRHAQIALNLTQLMTVSPEASREIQHATLALSIANDAPSAETINAVLFSSLN